MIRNRAENADWPQCDAFMPQVQPGWLNAVRFRVIMMHSL